MKRRPTHPALLLGFALLGLTLTIASCAPPEPPAAEEETASALTPGTYYQSPLPAPAADLMTWNYTCGGLAWTMVQPVRQLQLYGTTWADALLGYTGTSFPSYNITTIDCQQSIPMTASGSNLYSTAPRSCAMKARLANQQAWSWVANVTIPTYGLQYFPAWNTNPQGYAYGVWVVDIDAPAPTDFANWGTGYGLSACTPWGNLVAYDR